jgi:hypothetical protein
MVGTEGGQGEGSLQGGLRSPQEAQIRKILPLGPVPPWLAFLPASLLLLAWRRTGSIRPRELSVGPKDLDSASLTERGTGALSQHEGTNWLLCWWALRGD